MKAMILQNNAFNAGNRLKDFTFQSRQKRWTAVLFVSSILGIISGIVGLVISGLNFFGVLSKTQGVGRLGTLLVVAAFPLMMLCAHAMDKIAEIGKTRKRQAFERENREIYRPEQWKKDEHAQL
jgi:fatty acid desaturase